MIHSARLVRLTSVAVVTCLAACSDRSASNSDVGRQIAEHLCPIQADCGCDPSLLIPDCHRQIEQDVAQHEREAIARGMELDPECLRLFLASIDGLAACEADIEWSLVECSVYHGSADVDEPCEVLEVFPLMTDCRPGLDCRQGACRNLDDPPILEEGESCSETQGNVPTGFLGECADGLICDSPSTRTCIPHEPIPVAPIGAACTASYLCEGRSYCRPPPGADAVSEEQPGTCTAPTPAGQPCTLPYECELRCDEGLCQTPPTPLCAVLDDWGNEPPP